MEQGSQGFAPASPQTRERQVTPGWVFDTFVAQVRDTAHVWVGYGQCMEHYGAEEPDLPLLEALSRLCRGPEGASLTALLQPVGPQLACAPARTASRREA